MKGFEKVFATVMSDTYHTLITSVHRLHPPSMILTVPVVKADSSDPR